MNVRVLGRVQVLPSFELLRHVLAEILEGPYVVQRVPEKSKEGESGENAMNPNVIVHGSPGH